MRKTKLVRQCIADFKKAKAIGKAIGMENLEQNKEILIAKMASIGVEFHNYSHEQLEAIAHLASQNFILTKHQKTNLNNLKKLFSLDDKAIEFVLLVYFLNRVSINVKKDTFSKNSLFPLLLDKSHTQFRTMAHKLSPLRLVDNEEYLEFSYECTTIFEAFMEEAFSKKAIIGAYFNPAPKMKLTIGDYKYMEKSVLNMAKILQNKGNSIMLYGLQGTGKSQLALLLANLANKIAYNVKLASLENKEKAMECRVENFQLAQKMLKPDTDIIIFDECENIFNEFAQTHFKSTINATLEDLRICSIFICNNIDIDPAFLRRFTYIEQIKAPPSEVLKEAIEGVLKPCTSDYKAISHHLSQKNGITHALIHNAKQAIKFVPKKDKADLFIKTLEEHLIANGDDKTNTIGFRCKG